VPFQVLKVMMLKVVMVPSSHAQEVRAQAASAAARAGERRLVVADADAMIRQPDEC
jgi:hypothetical protein